MLKNNTPDFIIFIIALYQIDTGSSFGIMKQQIGVSARV